MSFLNFSHISDLGVLLLYSGFEDGAAHRSFEAGFGHYNFLPSSTWRLETFIESVYGTDDGIGRNKVQYLQNYSQTNIGRNFDYFQIGWSLRLKKYALIVNGSLSFRNFSEWYDFGPDWGYSEWQILHLPEGAFTHHSIEAGSGRYNLLPSSSRRLLEVFAGAGYGNANECKDL